MADYALSGGDKLQAALAELSAKVTKAATLRVGFLEGAPYPNGTSVPMIAAIQEFGAPKVGIPPRPYFRTMIAAKSGEWGPLVGDELRANGYDVSKALDGVGQVMVADLQQSIHDLTEPKLSPVTVMMRKLKSEDQTLGEPGNPITRATVASARWLVDAGESTAGISDKPLIEPGVAGGTLVNAASHEVVG